MRNEHSVFVTIGASNHSRNGEEREKNDYYATDPKALELLLDIEKFSNTIWECACGEGHLSKVLIERGYTVVSTDLIDRNYGIGGVDFLNETRNFHGDILTNPPYKYAKEFVEHGLELIDNGHKVIMFLKIQFLESKSRRSLFDKKMLKTVYVSTSRLNCCKNGEFTKKRRADSSAQAYAWFIFEKGYKGDPVIKWFN